MKTHMATVVADPDGGNVWAYVCHTCRRVATPYYTEKSAQMDADKHTCADPRPHERTEILDRGSDPVFAGLLAAAWAALNDWTVR